MPDNTQYTRCPECHTAFKVSDKMLSMAKGKVRCGACLVVFQATDYILKAKLKTPPAAFVKPENKTSAVTYPAPVERSAPLESIKNQPIQTQSALDFSETVSNDKTAQELEVDQHSSENITDPFSEIDDFDNAMPDDADEAEIELDNELSEENADFNEETYYNQEPDSFESPDFDQTLPLDSEDTTYCSSTAITESSLPVISDDGKVLNEVFIDDASDNFETEDFKTDIVESETIELKTKESEDDEFTDLEPQTPDPEISFDDGEPNDLDISIDSDLNEFELEDFEASGLDAETDEDEDEDEDVETIKYKIEDTFEDQQQDDIEPVDIDESEDFVIEEESYAYDESDENESFVNELLDIDIIDEKLDTDPSTETDILAESDSDETFNKSKNDSNHLHTDENDFETLADTLANQINDTDTDPDPLDEFEERVEQKKTTLRSAVVLIVAIVLLSSLSLSFWNNRQELAWDQTWGSVTTSICAVLPCDLKPRRDVSKIRLRQRVVTPLENNENRLSIKLLLTNEATFAQPYPTISINFSSPQGESIAIKRFLVKDYFPEKQNQLMPADAEVHISFETDLPHPNALGFEFNFE